MIQSALVNCDRPVSLHRSQMLVIWVVGKMLRVKLLVLVGSHVVVVSHQQNSVVVLVVHTVDSSIIFVVVPELRLLADFSLLQENIVYSSLSRGILILSINFDDHQVSVMIFHLRLDVKVTAFLENHSIKGSESVVFSEIIRLSSALCNFKGVLGVCVGWDDDRAILSILIWSSALVDVTCTLNCG